MVSAILSLWPLTQIKCYLILALMALCERRMKTTIYKLAKGDRTVARVEDSARHGSVLDRIM